MNVNLKKKNKYRTLKSCDQIIMFSSMKHEGMNMDKVGRMWICCRGSGYTQDRIQNRRVTRKINEDNLLLQGQANQQFHSMLLQSTQPCTHPAPPNNTTPPFLCLSLAHTFYSLLLLCVWVFLLFLFFHALHPSLVW